MENPNLQKLNLSDFPFEVLFNILLNAEPKDIVNYCQTSHRASEICRDNSFWRMKLLRDYGEQELMKGMTWHEQYQRGIIRVINSPIFSGYDYYGIIDDQGDLYMAGNNENGQLGNGTFDSSKILEKVLLESKVISADTTGNAKLKFIGAVTTEGEVYIWGAISNTPKDVSTDSTNFPPVGYPVKGTVYVLRYTSEGIVYVRRNRNDIPKGDIASNLPWKLDLPGSGKAVKFIGTKHRVGYAIIMDDGSINVNKYKYTNEETVNIRLDSGGKIVDAILVDGSFHVDENYYAPYMYVLDNQGDVYFFYAGKNRIHKVKMGFLDRIKQ